MNWIRRFCIALPMWLSFVAPAVGQETTAESTPLRPSEQIPKVAIGGRAELAERLAQQAAVSTVTRQVIGLMRRDHDGSPESATRLNTLLAIFASDAANTVSASMAASQRTIEAIRLDRTIRQRAERSSRLEYQAYVADAERLADRILDLEDGARKEPDSAKRLAMQEQREDLMADLDEAVARRKYHEKNAAECKTTVERYDAEMKRIEDVQRMLNRQARRGQGALFRLWDAIGPETEASSAVEEERRPLREIMDVVKDLELDRDLIPAESENPTDRRGVNISTSSTQPSGQELKADSAAAREELERARQRRQKPADRAPLPTAK